MPGLRVKSVHPSQPTQYSSLGGLVILVFLDLLVSVVSQAILVTIALGFCTYFTILIFYRLSSSSV